MQVMETQVMKENTKLTDVLVLTLSWNFQFWVVKVHKMYSIVKVSNPV